MFLARILDLAGCKRGFGPWDSACVSTQIGGGIQRENRQIKDLIILDYNMIWLNVIVLNISRFSFSISFSKGLGHLTHQTGELLEWDSVEACLNEDMRDQMSSSAVLNFARRCPLQGFVRFLYGFVWTWSTPKSHGPIIDHFPDFSWPFGESTAYPKIYHIFRSRAIFMFCSRRLLMDSFAWKIHMHTSS